MQEAFEKIKTMLYNVDPQEMMSEEQRNVLNYCIEIVNQVAEEYKHGHFGCNMNGQHEKCKDCGLRGECSHCNTEWFGVKEEYKEPTLTVEQLIKPNPEIDAFLKEKMQWDEEEHSNSEIPNNSGWIPCSSGNMPETEESCWITYEDAYGNLHVGQDIYCDYGGWYETEDTAVKAWMYVNAPAPYQPKGEK